MNTGMSIKISVCDLPHLSLSLLVNSHCSYEIKIDHIQNSTIQKSKLFVLNSCITNTVLEKDELSVALFLR